MSIPYLILLFSLNVILIASFDSFLLNIVLISKENIFYKFVFSNHNIIFTVI